MVQCFLSYIINQKLSCYNGEYNIEILPYKKNEKKICMPLHSGTHMDFPFHVCDTGKKLQDYGITNFIYDKPYLIEISSEENYFSSSVLQSVPLDIDCLLIKNKVTYTRNSKKYYEQHTGISADVAKFVRNTFKNIRCVGINSISINAYQDKNPGRLAHKEFLEKTPEILIIEDLDLTKLREGYLNKLIVAPLLVENADGVPVTVIAEVEYEL